MTTQALQTKYNLSDQAWEEIRKTIIEEETAAQEKIKKFEEANTIYREHLDTMERTLDEAVGKIDSAASRRREASEKVLQEAMNSLEEMKKEVLAKKSSVMKEWADVAKRVESTNLKSVRQLQEAKEELSRVVREVASLKEVQADL